MGIFYCINCYFRSKPKSRRLINPVLDLKLIIGQTFPQLKTRHPLSILYVCEALGKRPEWFNKDVEEAFAVRRKASQIITKTRAAFSSSSERVGSVPVSTFVQLVCSIDSLWNRVARTYVLSLKIFPLSD